MPLSLMSCIHFATTRKVCGKYIIVIFWWGDARFVRSLLRLVSLFDFLRIFIITRAQTSFSVSIYSSYSYLLCTPSEQKSTHLFEPIAIRRSTWTVLARALAKQCEYYYNKILQLFALARLAISLHPAIICFNLVYVRVYEIACTQCVVRLRRVTHHIWW